MSLRNYRSIYRDTLPSSFARRRKRRINLPVVVVLFLLPTLLLQLLSIRRQQQQRPTLTLTPTIIILLGVSAATTTTTRRRRMISDIPLQRINNGSNNKRHRRSNINSIQQQQNQQQQQQQQQQQDNLKNILLFDQDNDTTRRRYIQAIHIIGESSSSSSSSSSLLLSSASSSSSSGTSSTKSLSSSLSTISNLPYSTSYSTQILQKQFQQSEQLKEQQQNHNQQQNLNQNQQQQQQQQQNNKNNKNNNLTAIVHMGPQKTASTFIQQVMNNVRNELLLDRYEKVYDINKQGSHSFSQCFKAPYTIMNLPPDIASTNTWPSSKIHVDYNCYNETLQQTYDIAKLRNNNVLISAESFANTAVNASMLYEYLSKYWNNIQIIFVYRRFYSWIVSYHNQHYKYKLPVSGYELIDWLDKRPRNAIQALYDIYYLPIEHYRKYFTNINVINLYQLQHNGNIDIAEYFYCTAIPNLNYTCPAVRNKLHSSTTQQQQQQKNNNRNHQRYLQQQQDQQHRRQKRYLKQQSKKSNSEIALVYKEIAYYAWNEDGWIIVEMKEKLLHQIKNNNDIQGYIQDRIQYYNEIICNRTIYTIIPNVPPECPSDEFLDWLYNISVTTEKILFPDYFAQYGATELQNDYNNNYRTKKLCTVRGKNVLETNPTEWKNFFSNPTYLLG